MASEQDTILRDLIDDVVQRPEFGARGRPTQVVMVYFTTPHNFSGSVKMSPDEWNDPETRARTVMQAVIDLEGPFWEDGGAT